MALAQSSVSPRQMYMAQQQQGRGGPSGLADVLEVLLDKGLVIDAFVRVSLIGIELLTIDVRVVVASVDTYLRFAEAVNRLDLLQVNNSQNLGDIMGGGSSQSQSRQDSDGQEAQSSGSEDGGRSDPDDDDNNDSSRNEDDSPQLEAGSESERSGDDDDSDESSDDKGVLTRIKERGQVF